MPNKINATKNRKAIITGGAGFRGSSFAKELAHDCSVIIIDNLPTGKKGDIAELAGQKAMFVNGNITDLSSPAWSKWPAMPALWWRGNSPIRRWWRVRGRY